MELLEAAGYRVVLADKKCCGRPLISKGMLAEAREHAAWNVERLAPFAEASSSRIEVTGPRLELKPTAVHSLNTSGEDVGLHSVLEYDPIADVWTPKADMPTARSDVAAAVIDGKVYQFPRFTSNFGRKP